MRSGKHTSFACQRLVPCLLYEQLYWLARLQNVWGEAIVQLELLDGLNSVS
jgi:hypothetical protein